MAKNKSTSLIPSPPQTVSRIHFNEIEYVLQDLKFDYSFAQNPVFQVIMTLKVPDEYINHPISISIPIPYLLSLVGMKNQPMAAYVQKVIDSYDNPQTRESQAFQCLESEGFDLRALAHCALLSVSIDPTDVAQPTEPIEKIIALEEVGFQVIEVGLGYSVTAPRTCIFQTKIKVPDHIFHDPIRLGFELPQGLASVEKQDAGMAKYFRQALAEHKGEPDYELVAIQELAEEGFDLNRFLHIVLSNYKVKITQKPKIE